VNFVSKTKDFRQTTAESIMSVPEIAKEDTDIGFARVLMREKNISRIPIVDKNQKLIGVVTIFDLLKAIKPHERMSFYSMSEEKETIMGIPLSTVMNDSPTTADKNTSLSEIVGLIEKYETDGIIVTENNFPVGVVTEKDLLEFYISNLEQKGISYQIIGLVDEDEFIVATADRMIRDTLQKLDRIHKIQYFVLHVKRYDKTGKIKYSIRTRLLTDKGTFVSKSYAWDLRTAVDEALDNLERITIKEKQRTKDKTQGMLRLKKLGM
jgi:CBS domain-containing protein/ribosome-associated translation inhibitor RaiA